MPGCNETPETHTGEPSPPPFSNSVDLHPALSSFYPITLKFIDVSYKVKDESRNKKWRTCSIKNLFTVNNYESHDDIETPSANQQVEERERGGRTILNGITGIVSPGEMLAVLGPSGSGKSTLLNAIAGRLHNKGGHLAGTVLANNKKLTKSVMKRTGFVAQDDVLYPHLTVRETLIFCALLRLPNSVSKQEKISVVEKVILELGLEKCEDTIVGNGSFIRGVSGGERKRVSIGHEMLINPSLLILDEPTSGLDSTAAYRLVSTLGVLAHQKGKTVVTSVHQPSSRVYQMFDSVLVLSEGRSLYFGKGNEAMTYLDSLGFSPTFPMNPADFLLDLANGVCQMENGPNECRENNNVKQVLVSSYSTLLAARVKAACTEPTNYCSNTTHRTNNLDRSNSRSCKMRCGSIISAWFNQFSILIQRGLKERRHETLNSLRVFQVLAASLLAGSMWWHSDFRDVQDRLGLLFFMSIFWGVFPSFNAVFAFPQERAIFIKERSSGMYTLSSYFMARITGDLPMELILPTLFLTITYWMAGLKPDLWAFVLTLMVMLGYVLVSQGLGLALGALIMDAKQASTVVTVTMLAFVLTGGFYVHKLPSCMAWFKYISTTFYCYRLLIDVQYGEGEAISSFLGCSRYHPRHGISDQPISCKFIEEDIVGQIHPAVSVGVFLIMFVGYRMIAYLAMRRMTS